MFIGSVFALKASSDLKPGEYQFQKHASLRDVIGTIVEGKVVQHAVTIPEGLTSEQIVARLSDNDIFAGTIREMPREGTLLPETYKFPRGTTREQVIQRMQQAQKRVLAEIWERRNPDMPVKTPEQLVTLASIVEKETGRADERSRVAAVFVNRLRQRMKLQSDPTIIYGLVGGKGTLGRPIKRSEIEQPSPYNTYVIEGLPPGPIANPGRASLEADRQSGAHQRSVLRRRRHRRTRLRRNLRRSTRRTSPSCARWKSRPERHGRAARRGRAAAAAGAPAANATRRPRRRRRPRAPEARPRGAAPPATAPTRQTTPPSRTALTLPRPSRWCSARLNSTRRESLKVARRDFPALSSENLRDGAVEHDRLCAQPRRQRPVCVRMGAEVGQRQGL